MRRPNPKTTREAWVVFFILGVVMLNYPFVHIFNKITTLFGIPSLILYFLIGWPMSIGVNFLFAKSLKTQSEPDEDQGKDLE